MNTNCKLIGVLALVTLVLSSCSDTFEPTPTFRASDEAITVSVSSVNVVAAPADSLNNVVTFTWNDPKFSVGLSQSKFSVIVAPANTNFARFNAKEFVGVLSGSLTGKELNGMALDLGAAVGQPFALEAKVIASHTNNNEAINSAALQITVTPFSSFRITASATDLVLNAAEGNNVALTLDWTSAFDGFTGVRSYKLERAKGGTSFAAPTEISFAGFSKTFTHVELNALAFEYDIFAPESGEIDFRVTATNELGITSVVNTTVTITPFAPPIYLMGAAVNGWGPWNDREMEAPTIGVNVFETVVYLTNGETFRFFAQRDWGPTSFNYPYFSSVDTEFENADDGDKNFRVIAATGYYKVTVNVVEKTVVAESVSAPVLYMTGAGVNDWNWNEGVYVQLTYTNRKPGVFEVSHQFKANNTFRFFAQPDWGPVSYNYPYFDSVDPLFVNGQDGDSNLRFVGSNNVNTKVRVDINAKTVTVLN